MVIISIYEINSIERGDLYRIKRTIDVWIGKIKKIINIAEKELENVPEGSLRLGKSKGIVQYYHYKDGTGHDGAYISKDNKELIKKLAQKSYDEKVLKYTRKTVLQIAALLKNYEDNKVEKIYLAEHNERQKLITPIEATYEQSLKEWISKPYIGKGFVEEMPVIYTNSGIRVRSKSEKIIADYFESVGIVYKYECPLVLKNYGTIYPDFTFLSRKTMREIYWEHEGMLDNVEYARNAVKKIELYEKNGIFPGEDLILTFETSTSVINTELIKCLSNKYLL